MVASNSALKSGGRSNKPQPPGLTRRPVSPNTWPHQKPHTLSSSARDRGGNGAGGGGAQSVRLHEQHERDSLLMAAAAGVGLGPAVSPYEVKPLQFADYSVGLAFKHLPILLIITGPLSLLLISIGSLWLLVIPCFSLQMVAIFLSLDEAQGASLLLHVMTLLAVALSLFMLAPLLLFSWWYLVFYMLCVCGYICCNVLLHLTIDSVVEDDRETAITLEVVLMKFYPIVACLAVSWALFSSMPIPISSYCIVFFVLLTLSCFCYPHRSSFVDPNAHADAILAYSDATMLSLSDWLIGVLISLAMPFILALASLETLSADSAFVHAVLQQAIILLVLSYSPCLEILKYTEVFDRRKSERWLRYLSAIVATLSLVYFFFTVDDSSDYSVFGLFKSQLCVSAVGALSLHYLLTHNYSHNVSVAAVLFATALVLFQLLAVQIDDHDVSSTPVESVYGIGVVLAALIIYTAICSKTAANKSLTTAPVLGFVFTWSSYASFLVSASITSPLGAHIINLALLLAVNGLYHSSSSSLEARSGGASSSKYLKSAVYLTIMSLLASVSVHLLNSPTGLSDTPTGLSILMGVQNGTGARAGSTALMQMVIFTCPSVFFLLMPCLLANTSLYSSLYGQEVDGDFAFSSAQWKCIVLSLLSTVAHCFFGGMKVSGALYTAFTDYSPSTTVKIGLLLCVVAFNLYHIWCKHLHSLLWLAFLACLASAGALIAITEPDIFNFRLCVSLCLVVFVLIWVLVITNVPSVVRNDVMMIFSSLITGLCFGTLSALLLIPLSPSPKLFIIFAVYVTVSASSAFVVLFIWRLWLKQHTNSSASNPFARFFKFIVLVNLGEFALCAYCEKRLALTVDNGWLSSKYLCPCYVLFAACFAVNSASIKWYQHKLAKKFVHHKLSPAVEKCEKVFTCLAVVTATVAAPIDLLPVWIPLVTMLQYRPGMKPWMSRQVSAHLSFAPMMTLFAILGFIFSLAENPLWHAYETLRGAASGSSSSDWGGAVVMSYWQQLFALLDMFVAVPAAFFCHAAISHYLWRGYIPKVNYPMGYHLLIWMAPLGLLSAIFCSSMFSVLYGTSSTFILLFALWNELPFSQ